jgi:hypothetical protein
LKAKNTAPASSGCGAPSPPSSETDYCRAIHCTTA